MTTERVDIRITEDGSKVVTHNIEGVGKAAEKSQDAIDKLNAALASIGVGISVAWVINRFAEVERSSLRLQAVLERTGNTTQRSFSQLNDLAGQLEKTTGRSAEEIKAAMANLATFSSIGGENFERAIKLGADMSEVYGYDLRGSLEAVARALDNPIKGFELLRKRGFSLDDQQKKVIQSLIKTGESAKAQAVILKMLEDQVGGVAEKAYGGLAGSLGRVSTAFGDLLDKWNEASGFTEVLVLGLNGVTKALEFLAENADVVAVALAAVAGPLIVAGVVKLAGLIATLGAAVWGLLGPVGVLVGVLAGAAMSMTQLSGATTKTIEEMGKMVTWTDRLAAAWEGVKAAAAEAFKDLPQYIADAMARSNLEFWKGWNSMWENLPNGMGKYMQIYLKPEVLERSASDTGSRMARAYVEARDKTLLELAKDNPALKNGPFAPNTPAGGDDDEKKKQRRQFGWADVLADLKQQNELLKVEADERERLGKIFNYENRMRREFTEVEREVVETALAYIQTQERQRAILDEIDEPQRKHKNAINDLLDLLGAGKIKYEDYTVAVRNANLAMLEMDRTIGGGIQRAMLKIEDQMTNFSKVSEDLVTQMSTNMTNALGDFFTTGKLGWADMESFVLTTINRMLAQQMLVMPFMQWLTGNGAAGGGMLGQALGFLGLGGPAAAAGGGAITAGAGASLAGSGAALGSLDGLMGFATGGSFGVGGVGGTDSQLVAFRATPNERVTIETPEQQRNNAGGSVQNFYITTPNADSFRQSQGQIMNNAAASMSRARARNS